MKHEKLHIIIVTDIPAKILLIRNCLELMEEIEKKIKKLDIEIMSRIVRMKEDVEIATSIPGIALYQLQLFWRKSGIIGILKMVRSSQHGVG